MLFQGKFLSFSPNGAVHPVAVMSYYKGWSGKADLRYALYQAALVASTRNKHFTSWFIEKLRGREKEKGIKTKMRVKLAAKLLIIAWTLMKKKEPFNPELLKIKK